MSNKYVCLVPSKKYIDVETGTLVGVSYTSTVSENLNEVLFSINKAKELELQDISIIEYLDIPVIEVYVGKRNMVFIADRNLNPEICYHEDMAEDGVIARINTQIINGHEFLNTSGVVMDSIKALERLLSNYEASLE